MSELLLTDIIVPEIFQPYVSRRTVELSNILQSELIASSPQLDEFVRGGGATLSMPRWNDLEDKESQVLQLGVEIVPDKLTAVKDLAPKLFRAHAWESSQLLSGLAGSNQANAIGDKVALWWARNHQMTIFNVLKGVFNSESMEHATVDASEHPLDAYVVQEARQVLGDNSGILDLILMHSATKTMLSQNQLIEYIPPARGEVGFERYLGLKVLVNDNLPYDEGVYTTYLASSGALQMGRGVPEGIQPVQVLEIPNLSVTHLYMRETTVINPPGISFIRPSLDEDGEELPSPTNEELADGENWKRYDKTEKKSIGLVRINHTGFTRIAESRIITPSSFSSNTKKDLTPAPQKAKVNNPNSPTMS